MWRQKRTPIRTLSPPLKRMLSSGRRISTLYPVGVRLPALSQVQSGARSSKLDALFSMSICTPTGFTIMWYETWPVPSASRLKPTQSSEKIVSRRATDALIRSGSWSSHWNAK